MAGSVAPLSKVRKAWIPCTRARGEGGQLLNYPEHVFHVLHGAWWVLPRTTVLFFHAAIDFAATGALIARSAVSMANRSWHAP